ncbi:hypothetical protein Halxa_1156 [Halopiger xanaduensis SH-6]|uniref:Uncharacterized protein n=1 Tax=Halopiger xanaduensis (strain DSM 18323 / JCM 14033 / SH-6) TaxID=797210 RepID=F8DAI4_HALXS|nr:hypothetical protein Halxa_1156 [Halopiger xanaduensis SH-6]
MNQIVHRIGDRGQDCAFKIECDERAQFELEPAKTDPDPEAEVVA